MAYTPELSKQESALLRRIAWNMGRPMTKTLSAIIQATASEFPPGEICSTCQDPSKCLDCLFNVSQECLNERS